ncbi:rave complex subunit rav2 [Gigaspora margarita]|uniref:Rave complex subunit rav2 n=1 Tax=Gigaspora margarita TaxID=4874 RepID=A0A8H4AAA7_GIGMA|nr:rave complex subunit rav2 [Gigaspora margarita]
MLHSNHNEMHAVIREEAVLKKELEWLLDTQLPNALYNIKKILKKCETIMKSPEHDDSFGTSTLAISSNNSDVLKGFVTLDGSDIIKGELQVKFSNYNRGNLLKLTVNPKKPYFLEQLIDAQNHITLALDALECSNNLLTKERSYELLDTVLKNISNARFILTCANEEKLFPYKICDPQMFSSKLPEDLAVQFHIEGSYIVVSVYALQYHSSAPQQKHGNILGSSKSPLKVCQYKDKYVSVLNEIVVKSLDPKLESVMECLKKLESNCSAWKNKIAVFLN